MLARTLQDMISDVRQRTNMENSTFVTDAELTEFLNVALRELWTRLCQNGGQPFYRSVTTIPVTAGTNLYALPSDFLALQGVEASIFGTYGRIDSFMPSERAMLVNSTTTPFGSQVRYRVQGNTIELVPATLSFDMTVFYTPSCPRLVNLSDTFDGFDGYEYAAIASACAAVKDKEETDPQFYMQERDRIYRLIDQMSTTRDMSAPERVQDVMTETNFGRWW